MVLGTSIKRLKKLLKVLLVGLRDLKGLRY